MPLIRQRTDTLFAKKVGQMIDDLGKKVKVFAITVKETVCDNCKIDAETKKGLGIYNDVGPTPFTGKVCPRCGNTGKIKDEKRVPINATISYGDSKNGDRHSSVGELPEGQAWLKTHFNLKTVIETATYFLLDGVRYSRLSSGAKPRGLLSQVSARVLLQKDL